jgi:hypothetical protein
MHTVLKASLALANTDWTGTNVSFFRSLQSGRQWPFMNANLAAHLPSATDVAGPTFNASCDVVHFLPDGYETVGDLLQKMRADQEVANLYEHTPLSLALSQLSEADRNALLDRGLSQLFNYLPNTRDTGATKLVQVQSEMNADTGLQWDFTSLGSGRIELFLRWDGCHFGDVAQFLSQFENWDKPLADRGKQTRYQVEHVHPTQAEHEPDATEVAPSIVIVDQAETAIGTEVEVEDVLFRRLGNVRSWVMSALRW